MILFFFLSSLSVVLTPFAYNSYGEANPLMYIIGTAFWLFLFLGLLFMFLLNKIRKKQTSDEKNKRKKSRCGIVSFFKNKYAVLFDAIFLIDLILIVILTLCRVNNDILILCLAVLLLFSFYMHCVFNGRNFNYIYNFSSSD